MNFNGNNIPSERVFNASKLSSSHLGGAFVVDRENILLNNSGIYGVQNPGNAANKPNIPKGLPTLGVDMAPYRVIGKRRPPPEDINTPVSQKKRRIDVAQGLEAGMTISNGLSPVKRRPRIADFLPIQRDSWFHLPEMWEYWGPDGQHIKERKWSPNQGGDHKLTNKSDRLHQNGDCKNATAATVATWVELNRLRARYQELVAEFHGGPLVVHHLADKESDEKLVAIARALNGLEKVMTGVGRATPSRPRPSWAPAPAPASKPIKGPMGAMATQIGTPVFVSPLDTLLFATPVEVASAQGPTPALTFTTFPTTLPTSPAPPPPSNSLNNTASPLTSAPPIVQEQEAITSSNLTSSRKPTKRTQKATRNPQPAPLASAALSSVCSTGQFRLTRAGEARFKLLCAQGECDEMWEMLPAEQHFEHISSPSAIAAFRSEHPRPNKGGKGKQVAETEIWVCKAKVRMERRELPNENITELSIVYLDEPCNGVAGTSSSMVRHKKRTHLGRPYDSNTTEDSGGKRQEK